MYELGERAGVYGISLQRERQNKWPVSTGYTNYQHHVPAGY